VYSPDGKYLRKIGGEGQGLSEIQRAGGVSFGFTTDDKLFFTQFIGGHRWITIMELSGELHKTLKLEITEVFGIIEAHSLKGGGFLAEFAFWGCFDFYSLLLNYNPMACCISNITVKKDIQSIKDSHERGNVGKNPGISSLPSLWKEQMRSHLQ